MKSDLLLMSIPLFTNVCFMYTSVEDLELHLDLYMNKYLAIIDMCKPR